MATKTQWNSDRTDDYGIERTRQDDPTAVDKVREKSPTVDHLMRMQDRYASQGGNQFSAGITYFSVLAMFPLMLLLTATAATILANRPDMLGEVKDQITNGIEGDLSNTINEILETAIAQRGAMFGVGGLTALWSGLGWMFNLRAGISAMWNLDVTEGGGNFFVTKFKDLIGLIGLLLAFVIAFGVTAIGSSGLIRDIFGWIGLDEFPGMGFVFWAVGLIVGLIANYLVMLWMIKALPRTKVPWKSAFKGALIGAVAFEAVKQLSTVIMSSAANNPAGAVFGPVIALMVVLYLVWRIVLYVSAWTATTEESMELVEVPVPAPAVIRVRNEIKEGPSTGATLGVGAALGAVAAGAVALLRRK